MGHGRGERGDIILGWLTKLVVALAVVGTVGYDGVSLGIAQFAVEDDGATAARAAADAYRAKPDLQAAYDEAYLQVADSGDTVDAPSFAVGPDGAVTLTLRREVSTLLTHRIPPLRHWTEVTRTVTSRPTG